VVSPVARFAGSPSHSGDPYSTTADVGAGLRVRSDGQGRLGARQDLGTRVVHRPPDRGRHAYDMLPAEVEQVPVSLREEVADRDLSFGVSQ